MSAPSLTQPADQASRRALGWADLADLLGVVLLAILVPALVLLPPALRVPLGIVAVLFVPGYAIQAALFPRDAFDVPTRIGISIGLSIALIPVLALFLNALPWGITPPAIGGALAVHGTLFALVGVARRWITRPFAVPAARPPFERAMVLRRGLVALGCGTGIAGLVALLLLVATPKPAPMTEFYALGQAGRAESYPTQVAPGANIQLPLGITSHEAVAIQYRVVLRSGATTLRELDPITLEPGATWRETVNFALAQTGEHQVVDVLLFASDQSEPYRRLQFLIDVRGEP